MAVTRVHNFNMAGAMVSSGEDDPTMDEDPMAHLPPGTRVHKDGDIDDPPLPTIEELTGRPAMKPKKVPAKVAPKAARVAADGYVSDRRRCLELAVASGVTDPTELLGIARQFLEFLEEA